MPLSISSGTAKSFGFAGGYPELSPDAPAITAASPASATSASITFTAPNNRGSSPITNYTIKSSPGNITATVNQSGSGTATITGLSANTSYTFTITATNGVGTSPPSAQSASITTPIYPPSNISLPAITGTAAVNQTLSCSTGTWNGSPTSYTYQWQRSGTNINGATSSSYVLVSADVNTAISCVVTATNAGGAVSSTSNPTANVIPSVPSAPTIGTATGVTGTSVSVTFTPPTNNGGSAITSYTVTSSPGNITATVAAGLSSVVVTGLTTNQAYTFTVTATNGVGQSAASSPSNTVTPILVTGQAIFTVNTPGGTGTSPTNFIWTVPEGVTSISAICVGAGGRSFGGSVMAGGGGALAYANNISVFPGQTIYISVGHGLGTTQNYGRASKIMAGVCEVTGGADSTSSSANNYAGAVVYGTGGRGGMGGRGTTASPGGGGGGGGYSGGNSTGGGQGAAAGNTTGKTATGGTGGAGGGGNAGGNGGGVGIFGVGSNGGAGGGAGSGGSGSTYGGGAGSSYSSPAGTIRAGGHGVVRIVWPGSTRQFPSTNVGNF